MSLSSEDASVTLFGGAGVVLHEFEDRRNLLSRIHMLLQDEGMGAPSYDLSAETMIRCVRRYPYTERVCTH